jgi:hypothetical protein
MKKSKKISKKNKSFKLSDKKYKELIKQKKSKKISKKNNKILDNHLKKKYCKCIKTLKNKYPKKSRIYKGKYGICMNSIYKNRGFKPPYNISNKCK